LPATQDRRAERAAARGRRARRDIAISAVSTIVVLGGLAALIVTSPGWTTVRKSFFSWYWFRHSFSSVLSAFWLDVKMFLIVEAIVLVLGLLVALCRNSRAPVLFPLKLVATVYTDVFRGIPTILLIVLFGFGIPGLALSGVPTNPLVLGGAALVFSYSAYVAEVYRAGIESVHSSQTAAALAVGLTRGQAMRYVVVPQAVRRVVPPLLNDFISLQKDVALVSVIGVIEALRQAQIIESYNFNSTPLVAAALLYICVTVPLARVLDQLQARARRRQQAVLV
jgi:polar amino acid transport system permease protein